MKYNIFLRLRPGAEEFLNEMAQLYEIIIFTASVREYGNEVIDKLDPNAKCTIRLFRENCTLFNGHLVKDLSTLNRDMASTIIIDNNITSFLFQPQNGIHIKSFINDPTDSELIDLIPFLKEMSKLDDVRPVQEWMKRYRSSSTLQDSSANETIVIQDDEVLVFG